MKVWITRYALTKGIIESEVIYCGDDMVRERKQGCFPIYYHGEGHEWHKTKESAIAKAEEMRKKKIASLKKQIEKLEKMKFE